MSKRDFRDEPAPDRVTSRLTSRRTVAKGMAWSVPVVAVAAAAPAFAVSCETFTFGAGSCKCPGQSTTDPYGYWLTLCYNCPPGTNANATGVATIRAIRNTPNGTPLGVTPRQPDACSFSGYDFEIPLGGCSAEIHLTGTSSGNYLYIDYTVGTTEYQFQIASPPDCTSTFLPDGTTVDVPSKCLTAGSC